MMIMMINETVLPYLGIPVRRIDHPHGRRTRLPHSSGGGQRGHTLVMTNSLLLKMVVTRVSFPIENDYFSRVISLPGG